MSGAVQHPEERVAALEAKLAQVLERVDALEAENRALRSAPVPQPAPPATSPVPEAAPSGAAPLTRRRVLLGSAGAAAAGAAAVLAGAQPAAANGQGQSWTLGDSSNSATASSTPSTRWTRFSMGRPRASERSNGHAGRVSVQ